MRRRLKATSYVLVSQALLIALAIAWLIHMIIIAVNGSVFFVENNGFILWTEISTSVIITIFAVWGGAGRLGQARTQNTIAIVKKEKISADFYYQNLRQRLEVLRNDFQDINPNLIQQLNIPQQVLEQIIQQSILFQKAKELGIGASDEEIRKEITSYPVFQREGKFVGFEEYEQILKWNRMPISEFDDNIFFHHTPVPKRNISVVRANTPVNQHILKVNRSIDCLNTAPDFTT